MGAFQRHQFITVIHMIILIPRQIHHYLTIQYPNHKKYIT